MIVSPGHQCIKASHTPSTRSSFTSLRKLPVGPVVNFYFYSWPDYLGVRRERGLGLGWATRRLVGSLRLGGQARTWQARTCQALGRSASFSSTREETFFAIKALSKLLKEKRVDKLECIVLLYAFIGRVGAR